MKTLYTLLALALCSSFSFGQVMIDQSVLLNEIPNMFLGDDYEISNVTFSGGEDQLGIIFGNGSNLGVDLGLALGTGNVNIFTSASSEDENTPGPGGNNSSGSTLGGGNFGAGDADLESIIDMGTHDAAVLEFDFIASTDVMSFEYVFASEEYPEWACSSFNDVFGFFLSGPGIDGEFENSAINIASIPDSEPTTYVSINNINASDCGSEYIDYYVSNEEMNADANVIEFDGFTVVMPAEITVIPGETYHLKLAIADAADTIMDSAVAIRSSTSAFIWTESEGSADEGGMTLLDDTQLMEGCFNGQFDLYLSYAAASTISEISLTGSATMGVDYADVSEYLTIPEDFVGIQQIPIQVLADSENEGPETVILSVTYTDGLGELVTISQELTILEQENLEVDLESNYTICESNELIEINATATSGVQPISYVWTNGDTEAVNSFSSLENGAHSVTLTDFCGNSFTHQLNINAAEPLELTENLIICDNEFSENIILSGAAPFTYTFNEDLLTQEGQTFGSTTEGVYTIQVEDLCGDMAEVELTVDNCTSVNEVDIISFSLLNNGENLVVNSDVLFDNLTLKIYDLNGKLVYQAMSIVNGENTDISFFTNGIYLVEISNSEQVLFKEKILK